MKHLLPAVQRTALRIPWAAVGGCAAALLLTAAAPGGQYAPWALAAVAADEQYRRHGGGNGEHRDEPDHDREIPLVTGFLCRGLQDRIGVEMFSHAMYRLLIPNCRRDRAGAKRRPRTGHFTVRRALSR